MGNTNLTDISVYKTIPSYTDGWAILGDSFTANVNSFLKAGVLKAGLRVLLTSGHSGYRSDQLIQYIPDVKNSGAKHCLIMCGTNDLEQLVAVTTFKSNLSTILTGLIQNGIEPTVLYIPTKNTKKTSVYKFNLAIYFLCSSLGVKALNVFDGMAEANGDWKTVYSSDGTHTNIAGCVVASNALASKILLNKGDLPFALFNGGGLVENPVFYGDDNADGIANGWTKIGALTPTASLIASTNGNKQSLTFAAQPSGDCFLYKNISGVSIGDKFMMTAKVNMENLVNMTVNVFVRAFGTAIDFYATQALPVDGYYYLTVEGVVPIGTTILQAYMNVNSSGTGSGKVEFESVEVANLTTMGLA